MVTLTDLLVLMDMDMDMDMGVEPRSLTSISETPKFYTYEINNVDDNVCTSMYVALQPRSKSSSDSTQPENDARMERTFLHASSAR